MSFFVSTGDLTFDAGGCKSIDRFFSRKAHVPNATSTGGVASS